MTNPLDMRHWARVGAEQRLREIEAERTAIVHAFPDLTSGDRGTRARSSSAGKQARGGWKMSAAQKRAVSKRMKKYWAARRAAK